MSNYGYWQWLHALPFQSIFFSLVSLVSSQPRHMLDTSNSGKPVFVYSGLLVLMRLILFLAENTSVFSAPF